MRNPDMPAWITVWLTIVICGGLAAAAPDMRKEALSFLLGVSSGAFAVIRGRDEGS